MIGFKVTGGPELGRALAQLTERMGKKTLRNALMTGGEVIRKAAAAKAPYDPSTPKDIRDNIVKSPARKVPEGEHAAVAVGPARGFAYGLAQEVGTKRHAAQPFMRPAFDTEGPNALGAIRQELQRELLGSARNVAQGASESFSEDDGPEIIGGPGGGLL
jgi:HK97 gp10 family phage protein